MNGIQRVIASLKRMHKILSVKFAITIPIAASCQRIHGDVAREIKNAEPEKHAVKQLRDYTSTLRLHCPSAVSKLCVGQFDLAKR
ncbi:MAG: hypothetical protein R3C28_04160 [Pirellulaceae bacterium]